MLPVGACRPWAAVYILYVSVASGHAEGLAVSRRAGSGE